MIDAKNWHEPPRVDGDALWSGRLDCSGQLRSLAQTAARVADALGPAAISPVAVRPIMAFAHHTIRRRIGPVQLVGSDELALVLETPVVRFTAQAVRDVAQRLAKAFPSYTRRPEETADAAGQGGLARLFEVHKELAELAVQARLGPVEDWMTYLSPDQFDLVRAKFSGPARISGPAGTGKTVVGLHRAAHLAGLGQGKVLLVTYVGSLARVQANLLRRMPPAVADNVEVLTIHQVARSLRRSLNVDQSKAERCFTQAWDAHGEPLSRIDPSRSYWRDEIDRVIKGRGFTGFEEYRDADRHGRVTPLHKPQREAVWKLYEEYERLKSLDGVYDWADLLLHALDHVRKHPATSHYRAVILDEAQDATLTGLRLLHALAGDRPNALLLIGDAGQSVYAGGYRLADAGIDVRGRSRVLRTNYRNGAAILDEAARIGGIRQVRDIDGGDIATEQDVDRIEDGVVTRYEAITSAALELELIRQLRSLAEPGAALVLCADNATIDRHTRNLTNAGLTLCNLADYNGIPTPAIKIGTFERAKGLEFKHVFIPGHRQLLRDAAIGGNGDPDRTQLAATRLQVGMLRARDSLWLGDIQPPDELYEPAPPPSSVHNRRRQACPPPGLAGVPLQRLQRSPAVVAMSSKSLSWCSRTVPWARPTDEDTHLWCASSTTRSSPRPRCDRSPCGRPCGTRP